MYLFIAFPRWARCPQPMGQKPKVPLMTRFAPKDHLTATDVTSTDTLDFPED